jgi:ribosomal protein S20
MFHRKSILRFTVVSTILMIVASATTLSIGTTTMKVQAQNAATPEQIKDYLTQAIQALESGDNAKAIQQLKLATDQIDGSTGVSVVSSNGESDEGEGVEEGPGEDADEPGDEDQNDEED